MQAAEEAAPTQDIRTIHTAVSDVHQYFEIERCKGWCREYGNVALQFPDHLLAYATQVYSALVSPTCNLHILADTNYGACCVDEVAAQRLSTRAIVHFGHACNSRVLSLPTLFVYGRELLDTADLVRSFKQTFSRTECVFVIFNTVFYHLAELFRAQIQGYSNVYIQTFSQEQNTPNSSSPAAHTAPDIDSHSIFYVGEESLCLTNIILNHGSRKVWSYNPRTRETRLESRNVNKMLIKRFSNIEKIKNSTIVGILVGTLGIKNFREVINRIKNILKSVGKKYYVVSIGKPNPPKLANFSDIGVFVMVGCPENSLLDCKEFYQPVVTPYELEIAFIDRPWEIDYISDCSALLNTHYIDIPDTKDTESVENAGVLDTFKNMDVTARFLYDRTWSGLEQRLGLDEPAVLKQGQKGIAGYYEDEPDCDSRLKN